MQVTSVLTGLYLAVIFPVGLRHRVRDTDMREVLVDNLGFEDVVMVARRAAGMSLSMARS